MQQPYLLLFFFAACLTACRPTATVYLVRHAERANDSDTTSLSAEGLQRAGRLAQRLRQVRLDTIYVTPYTRTRQTAQPTASLKQLPLTQYAPAPVTQLTQRIYAFRHQTALVVGHSNTILEIARALNTSPAKQRIEHTDYANLFVITLRKKHGAWQAALREETY